MDDTNNLSEKVSEILGSKVVVTLEDGIGVFELSSCQLLLSTTKVPAKITAEWIVKRIAKRTADSERLAQARDDAAAKLKAYMTQAGIKADGINLYFTSFGFSVDNLFQDGIEKAKEILNEVGIAHRRLEYSAAHWVVRVFL